MVESITCKTPITNPRFLIDDFEYYYTTDPTQDMRPICPLTYSTTAQSELDFDFVNTAADWGPLISLNK